MPQHQSVHALPGFDKQNMYLCHAHKSRCHPGGVSDALAALLQLQDIQVLDKDRVIIASLLSMFPTAIWSKCMRPGMQGQAGWATILMHFCLPGRGQFCPGGANLAGQQGQLEEVSEYKLETLVQRSQLAAVLAAMKKAHPYEEVAYDIVPLENKGEHGLGRIGHLPQPMALGDFAARLAKMLGCPAVKVCGEKARQVSKVAVCGGSGGDLVTLAHYSGADVLVTGDVGHHAALEAAGLGLSLVDPGHYASEFPSSKFSNPIFRTI